MRQKYTKEEFDRIRWLVDCAVTARTKAEAKKYYTQLDYITFEVSSYSRNCLSELKAATMSAAGAVRDKARLVDNVRWYLSKFEITCVE